MNGVGDGDALKLGQRCSKIFERMAVGDLDMAARRYERNQRGDSIGNRAKMSLAPHRAKPATRVQRLVVHGSPLVNLCDISISHAAPDLHDTLVSIGASF